MNVLYDQTATLIRWIYDSRIDGPPVLELETHFPGGLRFVEAWRALRDEAMALATRLAEVPRFHEIMPEQTAISANDARDWRMFIVKAYGTEVPENKARCPILASIVEGMPEVLSASYSFMAPGKHIPAHRGPFRGVLRFYLALSMPRLADGRPGAVLRVADGQYRLEDGDYMLWDDTYSHEVWNESDEVRAVLLLDVWRPGMPADMQLFSRALISIVRAGMRIRGFA
ncbi:MAG TPA: aspartyl/asparaginyl beta-hydroxylase domain-containing protein [Stellaceae bacterium]|nr:aspartyl/asparaginyl beta-hydroxylase domain-containing protein [Stellaceae bacterium]